MTLHFHDWALLSWAVLSLLAVLALGRAMCHASRDDWKDEQEDRRG